MTSETTTSKTAWPIFVISLADAHDRRSTSEAALSALDLEFDVFDAVDGRQGLPEHYQSKADRDGTLRDFGRPLSDAEYACAFSHLAVYDQIIQRGLPGAIVLEDDAILTPLFADFLQARGYEHAELIQLDHLHGDIWRGAKQITLTPDILLAPAARNTSLTTGYSISNAGARYFLDNAFPLTRSADWPCDPLVIGAMLALPRVIDHPPFTNDHSTIEADRIRLKTKPKTSLQRATRFFHRTYWRRWWFKRRTRRVS